LIRLCNSITNLRLVSTAVGRYHSKSEAVPASFARSIMNVQYITGLQAINGLSVVSPDHTAIPQDAIVDF
jgi:hypothetical protein